MTTTTDISKFGARERAMLIELLTAWNERGLPNDFTDNEVAPMMNFNSGNVFLTNSEYEVAMMNGDKLESFYSSPYEGLEGFFNELLAKYPDMHSEDREWLKNIAENIGRVSELPDYQEIEENEG